MSHVCWQVAQGADTIGGTVIVLAADGWRLVLDLGSLYTPAQPVFDSRLRPRGIRDLQRLGRAPVVPGLFTDHQGVDSRLAVAISHAHFDHCGLLPYVRSTVPVWMTAETRRLLTALPDAGLGPEIGALDLRTACPGEPIRWGPFTLTAVLVDHDVAGACAWLVEAPGGRLAYSGDLRLHGRRPYLTWAFARRARDFQPDVLFLEGTRVRAAPSPETEQPELGEEAWAGALARCLETAPAGAYIAVYPMHTERVQALQWAVRMVGRRLMLTAPTAYLYAAMHGQVACSAVLGGDEDTWTPAVRQWLTAQRLPVWLPQQLHGQERAWVVELPYERLTAWVDIRPADGGLYIHADANPGGPFDPAWANLLHWLDVFGVRLIRLSASGHATPSDLQALLTVVQPRWLVPVHTLAPAALGAPHIRRLLVQPGQVYTASGQVCNGMSERSEGGPDG
ncbi:MAG: hypothetical protein K6T26_00820 [Alicyclobacillus sp.]|nr:hypothetical protein [Alicyclobacillus sp.]